MLYETYWKKNDLHEIASSFVHILRLLKELTLRVDNTFDVSSSGWSPGARPSVFELAKLVALARLRGVHGMSSRSEWARAAVRQARNGNGHRHRHRSGCGHRGWDGGQASSTVAISGLALPFYFRLRFDRTPQSCGCFRFTRRSSQCRHWTGVRGGQRLRFEAR